MDLMHEMSEKSRKKDLCIKIIRSHLLSSPAGLALWQLERDYEASESQKLPYSQFGYTDLLSFLKSLPDVVRINYRSDGQLLLHGVADESSQHVKRLIDRQRKKPAFKKRPLVPTRRPCSSALAARRHMGRVSDIVRQSIFKVLQLHTSGIALPDFLDRYKKEIGVALVVERHGFRSLPDLFLSIPDTCRLEYGRRDRTGNMLYIFPSKSTALLPKSNIISRKLIANAYSSQYPTCDAGSAVAKLDKPKPIQTMLLPAVAKHSEMKPIQSELEKEMKSEFSQIKLTPVVNQNKAESIETQLPVVAKQDKAESVQGLMPGALKQNSMELIQSELTAVAKQDRARPIQNLACEQLPDISLKVEQPEKMGSSNLHIPTSCEILRTRILKILEDQPDGIRSSQVLAMYKEKYGQDLEFEKFGYFSIIEFVSTFSNEISISRSFSKSEWLLAKRSSKANQKSSKNLKRNCFDEGLEVTKMEIKEMLITSENGILVEKLTDAYERTYRHGMDLDDDTASGLIMLLLQIEGCVVCKKMGKLIVALSDEEKLTMTGRCPSRPLEFPADATCQNTSYKQLQLPSSDVQYIDIFVADVTNPEYFFVQICGRETTGALNDLMDALERFYCSPECDKYKIPSKLLKVGQICATVFMEDLNWHRAVIIAIYEGDFADVLYVDYGSVATVPVSSLRLLKSCFLSLPSQMVEARLSNIRPRDLKSWTLQARDCMLDMCRDRPLVAIITDIKDRVLSVCLCDTTKPDVDVHINDTLVEKKHAVFFPDGLSDEQQSKLRGFLLQQVEYEKAGGAVDFDHVAKSLLGSDAISSEVETARRALPQAANCGSDYGEFAENLQEFEEGSVKKKVPTAPVSEYIQKYSVANGKYTLHVIAYEGNPMLASFEISRIFHQTSDMLRPQILMNNLRCEELVVTNDGKHTKLFDALHEHEVIPSEHRNVAKDVICLYQLSDLPTIVKGIGHENEAILVSDARRMLRDLDASSKFKIVNGGNLNQNDLATLKKELEALLAARKVLIDRASAEPNPPVEQIIAIERKICEKEDKIRQGSLTWPKEVTSDSENNNLADMMMSQYNLREKDFNNMEVAGTDQTLMKSGISSRVAQIAPSVRDTGRKEGTGESEQLWSIPGAHVQHDVVQFLPRVHNAGIETKTAVVHGTGASGASIWGHSHSSGLRVPQHGQQLIGIQGHCGALMSNGFVQPHVPFGVPQWTQWSVQQQVSGTPTGQVYMSQIKDPSRSTVAVQGHNAMGTYPNQNHTVTLQPGPFSLFLPV